MSILTQAAAAPASDHAGRPAAPQWITEGQARGDLRAVAALAGNQPTRGQAIRAAMRILPRFPAAERLWEAAECSPGSASLALVLQHRYQTASQVAASARWAAGAGLPW